MYICKDCTPIQFFNIAHDQIDGEYQRAVESYKSQLKSMDRIIASDHLKNFNVRNAIQFICLHVLCRIS